MKAAVLQTFDQPPQYADFPDPTVGDEGVLLRVKAASLKNIDRMMANGTHYDAHHALPVVCGVDGVGVLDDGSRVYSGGVRAPYGMMAEYAVVPRGWTMPIPDTVDDLTAAALPNPALSGWLALVWRAQIQPGNTVMIMGATGAAGRLAIQIARLHGATRVVAVGRNATALASLTALGVDATISLSQPDEDITAALQAEIGTHGVDIILDYIWGRPTELLIDALTGHDILAESSRVKLIQIGEMAGPTIRLPAAALRSSNLEIYGSGGGSVPYGAIFDAFPKIWSLAAEGKLCIETEPVALANVAAAWQRGDTNGRRIVLIP